MTSYTWLTLGLLLLTSLVEWTYIRSIYKMTNEKQDDHPQPPSPLENQYPIYQQQTNRTPSVKTILLWNNFFRWPDYNFGLGQKPFIKNGCKISQCRTTLDKQELFEADAVMFHGALLHRVMDIPEPRDENQVFVFADSEPPGLGKSKKLGLSVNITITYRTDSTIQWPYGEFQRRTGKYKPIGAAQLATKTKLVAWMISDCMRVRTVRLEYAKELMRYIDVDVYGRCGNLTCTKHEDERCMDLLDKTYKFYLAFENSECTDYFTEKVYRTMTRHLVPVVMGAANYSKFLPPNSFIAAADFQSPKHLAEYLLSLDRNQSQYLQYFKWKKDYQVEDDFWAFAPRVFCRLCELLHTKTSFYTNFNVSKWYEVDQCALSKSKLREIYHVAV